MRIEIKSEISNIVEKITRGLISEEHFLFIPDCNLRRQVSKNVHLPVFPMYGLSDSIENEIEGESHGS